MLPSSRALKTDPVEASAVSHELERLAASNNRFLRRVGAQPVLHLRFKSPTTLLQIPCQSLESCGRCPQKRKECGTRGPEKRFMVEWHRPEEARRGARQEKEAAQATRHR